MDNDKKTDLVRVVPPQAVAPQFRFVPGSLGEAMEMARLITASELCPAAYRGKPGDAVLAYEFGQALGLSWMQALKHVAVINGVTSIFGDAVPAIIYASGQCERFNEFFEGKEFEDTFKAVCVLKRKGYPDERRFEYSVRDAKVAKLWGKTTRTGGDTPWITNPKRMLRFRCLGFGARDVFADKLSGLILAEEAMDYPDAIDVSPGPVGLPPAQAVIDRLPEALRDQIEKAFETLQLAPGLRTAKLTEFLTADVVPEEGAEALLNWCRDEFSKRKTGQPRKRAGENGKEKAKTPSPSPTVATSTAVDPKPGDSDDRPTGAEAAAGTSHPPASTADRSKLTADENFSLGF